MNMSKRFGRMLKEWALFFGLLVVLHVLYFAGWVWLNPVSARSAALIALLTGLYILGVGAILLVCFRRLGRAISPPEFAEAREHGLHATAKVLEIQQTRWRVKPSRSLNLRPRPRKWEYQMRLRVTCPERADYEATLAEFLTADRVPKKGATVSIKIHAQHPEIIVLSPDESLSYSKQK